MNDGALTTLLYHGQYRPLNPLDKEPAQPLQALWATSYVKLVQTFDESQVTNTHQLVVIVQVLVLAGDGVGDLKMLRGEIRVIHYSARLGLSGNLATSGRG